MKFIGQFIQDFIARFRNDVYLEDIDSGTIASGGNLGLDSNNKIVKANVAADTNTTYSVSCVDGDNSDEEKIRLTGSDSSTDDVVLEAGTGLSIARSSDKITFTNTVSDTNTNQLTEFTLTGDSGSNQTIAHGNTLDVAGGNAISTVVSATDTVTVNHDDTSSQASVNNSGNTVIQDVTLDTYGHVTGLTSAALSIPTVITATAEEQGIASFPETDFTLTDGAVAINPKAYFLFQGYGTSDGTNYEMAEILSDSNAPFEHNTSRGTNGLTAGEPRAFMKAGAKVMPRGGVLKKWTGWSTSAGSGTVDIGLFKVTPTRNSTTNLTPVLLKNHQYTALGNTKLEDFDETSFSVTFSAGDMIYMAVKGGTSGKLFYVDSTLEVQFS